MIKTYARTCYYDDDNDDDEENEEDDEDGGDDEDQDEDLQPTVAVVAANCCHSDKTRGKLLHSCSAAATASATVCAFKRQCVV